MVNDIRIYFEGGGDGKGTKLPLREGFHTFLREVVTQARSNKVHFRLIACGPRHVALDDFANGVRDHPQAFCVLLVDAEGPVAAEKWLCLPDPTHWKNLGLSEEHCHLMVQLMEAWFIADIDALSSYYGQGFQKNAIPANPNIEEILKDDVLTGLERATNNTTKGEYHKIKHASDLLARIDPTKVRSASTHCNFLFTTLLGITQ